MTTISSVLNYSTVIANSITTSSFTGTSVSVNSIIASSLTGTTILANSISTSNLTGTTLVTGSLNMNTGSHYQYGGTSLYLSRNIFSASITGPTSIPTSNTNFIMSQILNRTYNYTGTTGATTSVIIPTTNFYEISYSLYFSTIPSTCDITTYVTINGTTIKDSLMGNGADGGTLSGSTIASTSAKFILSLTAGQSLLLSATAVTATATFNGGHLIIKEVF